jgi:uncharacterized membrane protein YgcG
LNNLSNFSEFEYTNEGMKHWFATFLLLVNMGLVPNDVLAGDIKSKMNYTKSVPKEQLDVVKFVQYLNDETIALSELDNTIANYNKEKGTNIDPQEVKSISDYQDGKWNIKEFNGQDIGDIENLKPYNYINDFAKIINHDKESELNKFLADYKEKTSVEIAVLVIPSLQGNDISYYGPAIGEKWGVGNSEEDNGIIMVISIEDRKWGIYTGYGVEGILPDAICSRIGRNQLVPEFKKGNYEKGIEDALVAITERVGDEQIQVKKEREKREKEEAIENFWNIFYNSLITIFVLLSLTGISMLIRKRILKIRKIREEINKILEGLKKISDNLQIIEDDNIVKTNDRVLELKKEIDNLKIGTSNKERNRLFELFGQWNEEYRGFAKSYNSIVRSVKTIKSLDNLPKINRSDDINLLYDELKYAISSIRTENIDILNNKDFQMGVYKVQNLEKEYYKLIDLFDSIKTEGEIFKKFKSTILPKIDESLEALKNIEKEGYKWDGEVPSTEEFDKIENSLNFILNNYQTNVKDLHEEFVSYKGNKNLLINNISSLISKDFDIQDAKKYVKNYNFKSLDKKISDLKKLKYVDDYEVRKIKKKRKEIDNNLLDYLLAYSLIKELSSMISNAEDNANRKKRRKEEEERRRRNSYSSSSSFGSSSFGSSSSGSSFGGFGGGSFGGGGASGSW